MDMFMRFLHMKINERHFYAFKQMYIHKILPELQSTEGCIFATLIQSTDSLNEFVSLTMWSSQVHAERYQNSDAFRDLLQEAKQYFAESSEWRVELSTDYTLEYKPVVDEPVISSYTVTQKSLEANAEIGTASTMFVRIVSAKIKNELIEEARRIYSNEIIPVLKNVPGCRYVFLSENFDKTNEAFSITVWDTPEDAQKYEESGLFLELIGKLKHTFSDLYQWKMKLQTEREKKVVTSEDIAVEHYSVVSGKSFS
jgi:heme-degrading monooxygenase HmoA